MDGKEVPGLDSLRSLQSSLRCVCWYYEGLISLKRGRLKVVLDVAIENRVVNTFGSMSSFRFIWPNTHKVGNETSILLYPDRDRNLSKLSL